MVDAVNADTATDSNGQPLLWHEAFEINGNTYTAEVTAHWYAGHGVVAGRYRWTVFFENEHRPIAAQGVRPDVARAQDAAVQWVTDFRAQGE